MPAASYGRAAPPPGAPPPRLRRHAGRRTTAAWSARGGPAQRRAALQLQPVWAARNASRSTDRPTVRLTERAPWPTSRSSRSSTGRPLPVACCSAAHSLRACSGSTRLSPSNTVNSTAGYAAPSTTRWYGRVRRAASRAPPGRRRCRTRRSRCGPARTARTGPCRAAARCRPPRRTRPGPGSGRRRRAARRCCRRRRRAARGWSSRASTRRCRDRREVVEHVLLVLAHARRGATPRPPRRRRAGSATTQTPPAATQASARGGVAGRERRRRSRRSRTAPSAGAGRARRRGTGPGRGRGCRRAEVTTSTRATTARELDAGRGRPPRGPAPRSGRRSGAPAAGSRGSVQPSHTSLPPSGWPDRPETVPTPGQRHGASRPSGPRTATSLTACRLRSTTSRPSSSSSTSSSTASGSSGTRSAHSRGRGGSAVHRRPRGRVAVGQHAQPAVAGDPGGAAGVDADLHLDGRGAGGEVEQPHVVARRGAGARAHGQPAAVQRHRAAVVVRRVEALAPHDDVLLDRRADDVAPDPAVELLLARGHLLRRQPAHVEERRAAGHPGDGGVAAAVDRPVDLLAGVDVEHLQQRLLVAAGRQLVRRAAGPPCSAPRRRASSRRTGRPAPGRRAPGRSRRGRASSSTACSWPGSRRVENGRPARQAGAPAEPAASRPLEQAAQPLAPGQRRERARRRARPAPARQAAVSGEVGVLEPAVGVGDRVAVQVLDEVEPGGRRGTAGRASAGARLGAAASSSMRRRADRPGVQAAVRSPCVRSSRRASASSYARQPGVQRHRLHGGHDDGGQPERRRRRATSGERDAGRPARAAAGRASRPAPPTAARRSRPSRRVCAAWKARPRRRRARRAGTPGRRRAGRPRPAPARAQTATAWTASSRHRAHRAPGNGVAHPEGRRAHSAPEEAGVAEALVLNATYEPLCVVPGRRAVVLVLARQGRRGRGVRRRAAQRARRGARAERGAAHPLRPGAVPAERPADAQGRVRPRRRPLRLLRRRRDEPGPRRPAQPRRRAQLGQRRVGLRALQPRQGRPGGRRAGLAAAAAADRADAVPPGGSSAPSRRRPALGPLPRRPATRALLDEPA